MFYRLQSWSCCQNKFLQEQTAANKLGIQLVLPPLPFGLWWSCSTASGKRVSFLPSFHSGIPLPSHSPSFSRCHILPHRPWCFFCNFSAPSPQTSPPSEPLTPPCVTGFFLITDPSSCYYSNPLLYNMPFYMSFHKGPIWSEGYGVRSWEMQLHGGNLCLGQNGGLTSPLLTHSSGHSGPSLTCWAHWIQEAVTDIAPQLSGSPAWRGGKTFFNQHKRREKQPRRL